MHELVAYSSDITVIVEIQDLIQCAEITLLLHKGEINAMFFTGDDELFLTGTVQLERPLQQGAQLLRSLRKAH